MKNFVLITNEFKDNDLVLSKKIIDTILNNKFKRALKVLLLPSANGCNFIKLVVKIIQSLTYNNNFFHDTLEFHLL